MTWVNKKGKGNLDDYLGVADGETEFEAGQILLSKANGLYYDVNTTAVITEPAGDANCSLRDPVERLVVELAAVSATTLTLKTKTSDDQSYEIDWGEGAGYEAVESNIDETNTYSPAFEGNVSVRFAEGQYPTEFTATNAAWSISAESLNTLNTYNTLKRLYLNSATFEQCRLDTLIVEGSKLSYFYLWSPETKGFGDFEWGQYLGRATDSTYLAIYVNPARPDQGTLDLDNIRWPNYGDRLTIDAQGAPITGEIGEFINYHSALYYIYMRGKVAGSNITTDTPINFNSEMSGVVLDNLDTTAKVDAVLNALATRSNPTWVSSKLVTLSYNNAVPSAAGLADKATIEAQTGNPTVTVNS